MKSANLLAAAACVAGAMFLMTGAGCESGGFYATYDQPALGYYDYDYYPNNEVYYYPSSHTWWWRDRDEWRHGRDLPHNFDIHGDRHVPVRLNSDRPYTSHERTRAQYPAHIEKH